MNTERHCMSGRNITIVAPVERADCWPRVRKVDAFFRERGWHVRFLGLGSQHTGSRLRRLSQWMLSIWRTKWDPKRDLIYAVGFTAALPVWMMRRWRRVHYVFDNPDNIWMSYKCFQQGSQLLRNVEARIVGGSLLQVVPSAMRIACSPEKTVVVRNMPDKRTAEDALALASRMGLRRGPEVTMYINGWLVETRGLGELLKLVKGLDGMRLKLILAGELGCGAAEQLAKLPISTFLGRIAQEEALAHYYESDLAFTFYDPKVKINTLAAPNKWNDCLYTKTPIFCNEEIETVQELPTGTYVSSPYQYSESMRVMVGRLLRERARLDEMRANFKEWGGVFWEDEFRRKVGLTLERSDFMEGERFGYVRSDA